MSIHIWPAGIKARRTGIVYWFCNDPWRSHALFFDIQDKLKIEDEVGREFDLASEAVVFAKQLAADIRCLETTVRPALAIEVVAENAERIHREAVFA